MCSRTDIPQSVTQSSNALGFDTVVKLCAQGTPAAGTAVSPLSITIALAMLAGGSEDGKRRELCTKLGLENLDELTIALSHLKDTLVVAADAGRQFTTANAVFADNSAHIIPTYTEYLGKLDAHLDYTFSRLVDGTDQINAWISQQTNGLIPSMLSRQILAQANMVLVNALAFKAVWQNKFNPENTVKDFPFRTSDTRTGVVEMMFLHKQKVLFHATGDYTAVCLPYASQNSSTWSFIAYLPSETKSVTDILPIIPREKMLQGFHQTKLSRLGLPKFDMRTQERIADLLQQLGYPISGTFPGISPGIMVQHIIHSVAILLDENGTEAAAATAVVLTRSRQPHLPSVVFDRPFVFSIVADDMDLVLFTGVFSTEGH